MTALDARALRSLRGAVPDVRPPPIGSTYANNAQVLKNTAAERQTLRNTPIAPRLFGSVLLPILSAMLD